MKVYLAHPRLIREKGLEIQKRLESIGITVVNPFKVVEQGQSMAQIVEQELEIISGVDMVVVIVDDVLTVGTTMEAFYAWTANIPLYVLWLSTRSEMSWYSYIASAIFTDIESLISRITVLNVIWQ